MAAAGGAEGMGGCALQFVTSRKELERGSEMRSGKNTGFAIFLFLGKETSSREKGKETWTEMGRTGKVKKCSNMTKLSLSETCKQYNEMLKS